ncbi:MAG: methyltransferase domain-containing protein [Acidimicrobiales bacterium]|nr:methyltransferase domain-containing protein [Acidimicrobiales bacterium]
MSAGRWDPEIYLRHASERLRPAIELLARVPLEDPEVVVDLGCGTGTSTSLLRERWPGAEVTGVDNSEAMIASARAEVPGVGWVLADIRDWSASVPVDVIYANASLHWVDRHDVALPRLLEQLADGGVLAVQMPLNHGEPSHLLITETAADARWQDLLAPLLRPSPVADPAWYHELLRPMVTSLDLWETVYHQELTGDRPVLDWVRGTALRPLLTALADEAPELVEEFEHELGARLASAYPPDAAGRTRFAFRRVFFVARR